MRTLRTRLIVAYLAALVPVLVIAGVIAYASARRALEVELGERMETLARAVAVQLEGPTAGRIARLAPDSDLVRERLTEQLIQARDATGLRRVRLVDAEFRHLVDTDQSAPFSATFDLQADRVELERVFSHQESATSVLFHAEDGTPFKRGYAPVVYESVVVAALVVEASASYTSFLETYRGVMIALVLGTIAVLVLVSLVVARRLTAPLTQLTRVAQRIGRGDLRAAVTSARDDEIGELAGTLEHMRRALAERDEERQLMLAGIAHEIRNPLGGMELFVGILEEELRDDPERASYAHRVRHELDYLGRVVGEFLSFAREREPTWRRFVASELFDEVRDALGAMLASREVTLLVEGEAEAMVSGDFEMLRGALHNVIQNAVQVSDAGASVTVRVSQSGQAWSVDVEDRGPGMSAEVLGHVFRPFYTTREKGTGLGLPLAKKTIELHRGTFAISSAPGEGTTAHFEIPHHKDAPVRSSEDHGGSVPSFAAKSQSPSPGVDREGDDEGSMMIG